MITVPANSQNLNLYPPFLKARCSPRCFHRGLQSLVNYVKVTLASKSHREIMQNIHSRCTYVICNSVNNRLFPGAWGSCKAHVAVSTFELLCLNFHWFLMDVTGGQLERGLIFFQITGAGGFSFKVDIFVF